ncbi:RHS repeat-associated core domain-containing protein [Verrucomicrobium spinosum]|uniref:RHS repeat-associated core domain-containing protein n=2 Tax=Verrucomicrobium spinosum TaxID=2736 RepID=UPI0001746443|nr:RHS repeat-associated core domain-containing protein [Verrucomicrobium spinosum]
MSEDQKRWTSEARPTEKTTLRLLDLTKVPTEKDLRMAGQLGEELQPTRSADPASIADPSARKKQEEDNLEFGKAIQKWNLHDYDEAQLLFLDHLTKYPDSPWAAESELHLGCASQYLGRYDEAQKWFEASQTRADLGQPMHQKALLRLGVVAMDRGELSKASELFAQLRANDGDPARMTYASYWIRALSLMKAKETALRDCGQKSLGEICKVMGNETNARELRALDAAGPHGFTIQELEQTARRYGMAARTVRASGATLKELPLPLVAHYRDRHFVAVVGREQDGKLKVYDTRVGHTVAMDHKGFVAQWSGLATVFSEVSAPGVRLASVQETVEAMGGCCGLPRNPDDLCEECCDDEGGGCSSCYGMPEWSINEMNMNLVVKDIPMWWDAPYGKSVRIGLTYNSLDSLIAIRPFGDKWMLNYASYLVVDPSGSVKVITGSGKGENFTPDGSGGYNSDARNATKTLTKVTGHSYRFELTDAAGTKFLYDVPPAMGGSSASSLLLSMTDKYGTAVTITHNAQGAITAVSHPAAVTTLSPTGTWTFVYGGNGKVSHIDDPFGRQVTFSYDGNGRLTGQTDMGGVAYGYSYTTAAQVRERDLNDPEQFVTRTNELFLSAITTPSGVTQFYTEPADGINNSMDRYPPPGGVMWENYRITVTDAMGAKEEHHFDGYSRVYWHRDKNHYKEGEQGTVKTVHHFTMVNGRGEISSTDHQGGGTSYYEGYSDGGQPGQTTSPMGADTYTYNSKGKVLTHDDGHGILFTYEYAANDVDEVRTKRTVDGVETVLSETEYDPVTGDVTAEEDQASLRTEYTRNVRGQLVTTTNPKGDVTTYEYDAQGYLETVKLQANGHPTEIVQAAYVYDDAGRAVSETDSSGYTLLHTYDDLNRRLQTIYPDATTLVNAYSCCNLNSVTARDGGVTRFGYDALKRLSTAVSPGRQTTTYNYDKVGNVKEVRFGRGEWIRWEYDSGNRVTAKIYPDNSRLTYGYEASSGRLLWRRDSQNRQTTCTYDSHGRLQSVTHPDLPSQSYTYDELGRQLTWIDGMKTTDYTYDVLGRLSEIDGPLADDTVAYTYDQWGRLCAWSYGGGTESYTFDSLGRVAVMTNPLGTFTPTYVGNSRVLSRFEYPVTGLVTTYSRLPVNADRRLVQTVHEGPGSSVLARYSYAYHADGGIATWDQEQPGLGTGRRLEISYDAANQMTAVVETPLGAPLSPGMQKVWREQYDASGNRTLTQDGNRTRTATFNNLNQMTELASGGMTWFRGQVNEASKVNVNGLPALVRPNGIFELTTNLGAGTHDVPIAATDKGGNVVTETWRVDNGSGENKILTYDNDGNLKNDGTRAYSWDARNRLVSFEAGNSSWSFDYDGANRRIGERKDDVPVREWVWEDVNLLEERLVGGGKHRFWSGGVEILDPQGNQTGKRFLLKDHLGSVRVVVGSNGAVTASYSYSPWGKRTRVDGVEEWGGGYTGHWWHESGLSLATYRPYDPELGRWLSRDPIAERGGLNLYGMVRNDPVNRADQLGLSDDCSIELHVGHWSTIDTLWKKRKNENWKAPCGYAFGTLSCWSLDTSMDIMSRIGEDDVLVDPELQQDQIDFFDKMNAKLPGMLKQAHEKADKICNEKCCQGKTVTIKIWCEKDYVKWAEKFNMHNSLAFCGKHIPHPCKK